MADDRWTGIDRADTLESLARRGVMLDDSHRPHDGWTRRLLNELKARGWRNLVYRPCGPGGLTAAGATRDAGRDGVYHLTAIGETADSALARLLIEAIDRDTAGERFCPPAGGINAPGG